VAGVAIGVVTACGGNSFVAGADAASSSDASADTAGAPSFCAIEGGASTFCDDFDGLPLTSKWTAVDQTNGATIAKDDSIFVSAPSSLESIVPASLGLASQRGRVERTFNQNASRITISFQLHIDAVAPKPATTGGTSLILVQLGDDTLGISANNSEVTYFEDEVTDGGGDTNLVVGDIVSTPIVLGQWVPATLDIDITNATLTASVNGISVGPVEIELAAGAGQTPLVYVGVQSKNASLMLQSHYDNVLINVTP
jgi:hypothetical protein